MTATTTIQITTGGHAPCSSGDVRIEINDKAHVPTRRHVQIPGNDQLTKDWFDIQVNPSASVRLLIADEIRRHGMVDRVTRERFGTGVAQTAARSRQDGPAAQDASVAGASPASPAAATPWSPPLGDPSVEDLERQRAVLDAQINDLAQLKIAHEQQSAFDEELRRQGITAPDGLLI